MNWDGLLKKPIQLVNYTFVPGCIDKPNKQLNKYREYATNNFLSNTLPNLANQYFEQKKVYQARLIAN